MIQFNQWLEAEKEMIGIEPAKMGNRKIVFCSGVSADFAYRCTGHSMTPTFYPGELVLIHQQNTFHDGQIVAIQIGTGVTLKRLFRLDEGFKLVPDNREFNPVTITGQDAKQIKIIGIAVARQ